MPLRTDRVGRAVLATTVSVLALVAFALLPVAAQGIGTGAPEMDATRGPEAGTTASDAIAWAPMQSVSGTWPYPVPRPPIGPISGTVPVHWPYPYPYWCVFGVPVPPPLPPGFPTPPPPTPMPSPTPGGPATAATYSVCPQIRTRVPAAVQQQALAEPWTIYGFGERKNPSVPAHPLWNPLRTELALLNPNVPYSVCNPVVWKSGCW